MGNCLNYKFNIKEIVNSKYNTVINLGYAGNGPLIESSYNERIFTKKCKKVKWFFYEGNKVV